MVLARSYCEVKIRSSQFLEFHSNHKNWGDDKKEVAEEKSNTLLSILYPGRVEMHVVLRSEVMVKNSIYVFKTISSSEVIGLWDGRIRSVEMASSTSSE